MIPQKLKAGDEVRVVSASRSMSIISDEVKNIAIKNLEEFGLKISYSKHVDESNEFCSSSIESRISDIHDAFADKNVKAILTTIGGFNVNQILKYLDYDLIKRNSKIICGFSDITVLTNAIHTKTGLITYSGPHFSSFGMLKGADYTKDYFKKCLFEDIPFEVVASTDWSDDAWYMDQEKRDFIKNDGYQIINQGNAEGKIMGGNLCSLNLLQGTEYFPDLKDAILFLEDDEETRDEIFDRDLQSLIHLPEFRGVRGIVIGRFQKVSDINSEKIIKIIKSKRELENIPVIANANFGHTSPLITFPIGGSAKMSVGGVVKLNIIEH